MTADDDVGLAGRAALEKQLRLYTQIGWGITLLGCALWGWGYFVTNSLPFVNWSGFAPHWISEFLVNWQEEVGVLLTLVGSIPVYYAQFKAMGE